jgi:hypothetical protein
MAMNDRPDPDPTLLTTENLNREVANLKEIIDMRFRAERELTDERFHAVDEKFDSVESHRIEQKADTQREITKAFDANTEAIGAVEKIQTLANERITAVEAVRQGGVDARVAIYGTIGLVVAVLAVLAANGVFTR